MKPRVLAICASAIAVGVLPAPPRTKLPTQTTGTGALNAGVRAIRLADEARPINLAVSLHGATQEERAALVPVAKKWPLAELMEGLGLLLWLSGPTDAWDG